MTKAKATAVGTIQSLGGIAAGIKKRKEVLDAYYAHPNYCKYCNKLIQVKSNEQVHTVRKKQFCSSSCAASYNNPRKPKKEKKPTEKKELFEDKPISYFFYTLDNRIKSNKFSAINSKARIVAKRSFPKECKICQYSAHVEVHHIKPIHSFSPDTPISVVNSVDNLVYLCPNHHWEVEHGLLSL